MNYIYIKKIMTLSSFQMAMTQYTQLLSSFQARKTDGIIQLEYLIWNIIKYYGFISMNAQTKNPGPVYTYSEEFITKVKIVSIVCLNYHIFGL
jgi:hypothetical protein